MMDADVPPFIKEMELDAPSHIRLGAGFNLTTLGPQPPLDIDRMLRSFRCPYRLFQDTSCIGPQV
jgi:hypothetical protein